jgi:hypothetical protein
MSNVGTIRSTSGTGFLRALRPDEQHLLQDHLLRLEPNSRRERFNGTVGDAFLKAYASRCFGDGTIVIAYIQDGVVRGAAELHAPECSPDAIPELAFSVESRVRRQGVGSALFEQILTEADRSGYDTLRITTNGENEAMKALAHKFGTHLTFRRGEATGTVDLKQSKPTAKPAPAWGIQPNPSIELVKQLFRGSEAMWDISFKFYRELLDRGHRLGTR